MSYFSAPTQVVLTRCHQQLEIQLARREQSLKDYVHDNDYACYVRDRKQWNWLRWLFRMKPLEIMDFETYYLENPFEYSKNSSLSKTIEKLVVSKCGDGWHEDWILKLSSLLQVCNATVNLDQPTVQLSKDDCQLLQFPRAILAQSPIDKELSMARAELEG